MNKSCFLTMLPVSLLLLTVLTVIFLFEIPISAGAYFGLTVLCPLVLLMSQVGLVHRNGSQAAYVYIEKDNKK